MKNEIVLLAYKNLVYFSFHMIRNKFMYRKSCLTRVFSVLVVVNKVGAAVYFHGRSNPLIEDTSLLFLKRYGYW